MKALLTEAPQSDMSKRAKGRQEMQSAIDFGKLQDDLKDYAKAEAKRGAEQRKHLVQVARQQIQALKNRAMSYTPLVITGKNGQSVVMMTRNPNEEIRKAMDQIQKQLKAALSTSAADNKYLDANDAHHDDQLESLLDETHTVERQTHFAIGHAVLKAAKACKHCTEEMMHCLEHSLALATGREEKSGRTLAAVEYDFTDPALVERMAGLQEKYAHLTRQSRNLAH